MKKITYLDATRWYRALIAGIRYVISHQDLLNNINVFPVPDRDTGTNMALTLNSVIESTYAAPKKNIHALFEIVADSALNGARGNSGAILAQFFQGMSEAVKNIGTKMEVTHFAHAVENGVKFSYAALAQPREGTILTVIKDFATRINQVISKNNIDFVALLHEGLEMAKKSLQNTTLQLKELKKAQVVDAGAQGFVDLLQGIYDFIHHGSLKDLENEFTPFNVKQITEEIGHVVDERHRYCTECLIQGQDIDQNYLRDTLANIGDCVVVAGSKIKTKIHIHANDPAQVFEICRSQGTISGEKADDMIQQQRAVNHIRDEIAILTDSGADIPEAVIAKLDIHVVPLQLHFGHQNYIDKVTINPKEFYQLLKTSEHHPKTSQPSFGDFYRQYQYLSTHYQSVIAIHISSHISGTINASESAASKIEFKNIEILDSRFTSVGQGLIVQAAAEAAKKGFNKDEVTRIIREAIDKTECYAMLPDLTYVAKGGRLSPKKRKFLELFNLVPVLTFTKEGKLKLAKCFFRKKKLAKRFARYIRNQINPQSAYRILVSHADCEADANILHAELKRLIKNIESIYLVRTGSTLGAHTGPESLAIAIQEIHT